MIRVRLSRDAVADLEQCQKTGFFEHFLAKLLRLEAIGKDAGLPLGGDLTGCRKIVVGDRTWRIVFWMSDNDSLATVVAIANRADDECYRLAVERLKQHDAADMVSLAAALGALLRPSRRQQRRRR